LQLVFHIQDEELGADQQAKSTVFASSPVTMQVEAMHRQETDRG
jgi:hypothetical protein